jgi:hypothetical protein
MPLPGPSKKLATPTKSRKKELGVRTDEPNITPKEPIVSSVTPMVNGSWFTRMVEGLNKVWFVLVPWLAWEIYVGAFIGQGPRVTPEDVRIRELELIQLLDTRYMNRELLFQKLSEIEKEVKETRMIVEELRNE